MLTYQCWHALYTFTTYGHASSCGRLHVQQCFEVNANSAMLKSAWYAASVSLF